MELQPQWQRTRSLRNSIGIFALVLTVKTGFKEYQVSETRGKFWSKALLLVENKVREHLNRLNIHKAMGPDGMHLQCAEGAGWCHCKVTFNYLWKVMGTERESQRLEKSRHHSYLQERGLGNYRLVRFTSVPGKVMKQLILGITSEHTKDKKIRTGQHGFTKGKLCLTDLIAFYNEVTSSEGQESTEDVVYFDFSKASNTVSHNILRQAAEVWVR